MKSAFAHLGSRRRAYARVDYSRTVLVDMVHCVYSLLLLGLMSDTLIAPVRCQVSVDVVPGHSTSVSVGHGATIVGSWISSILGGSNQDSSRTSAGASASHDRTGNSGGAAGTVDVAIGAHGVDVDTGTHSPGTETSSTSSTSSAASDTGDSNDNGSDSDSTQQNADIRSSTTSSAGAAASHGSDADEGHTQKALDLLWKNRANASLRSSLSLVLCVSLGTASYSFYT